MNARRGFGYAALAAFAIASAGCGGGSSSAPGAPAVTATPNYALDDWSTFAHDQTRTAFQSQMTVVNAANVAGLRVRWQIKLGEGVHASPLVVGGTLYVAGDAGSVVALDAASGAQRWRTGIGSAVRMTPLLANGVLYAGAYGLPGPLGTQPSGAAFVALDARSGALLWRTPLPGLIRSEPVVLGGVVYEGIAGGDDFTGCVNGRVLGFEPASGAPIPALAWFTTPNPNGGGGVWSPLSTDGTRIFFGTGNTCDDSGAHDSIVATGTNLRTIWRVAASDPAGLDEDVGGGVTLANGTAYATGKSGFLYAIDTRTGSLRWRSPLGAALGGGGIGTPATDGTTLVVPAGLVANIIVTGRNRRDIGPRGALLGFDLAGNRKWSLPSQASSPGHAALESGLGFATLDNTLVAFDPATGSLKFTYTGPANFYASPALVPSGVYTADLAGNVTAFAP